MSGHIRNRYDASWIVTVEFGRDPVTSKRRRRQLAVRGSRRDAERVLRELEAQVDQGILPGRGRQVTVSELLDA